VRTRFARKWAPPPAALNGQIALRIGRDGGLVRARRDWLARRPLS
jgi:hypothetical protein